MIIKDGLHLDLVIGLMKKFYPTLKKLKLGLKEQIIPRHQTVFHRLLDAAPDPGFVIMFALIGGIDAAKPLFKGKRGQTGRLVLLPGGAINKAGNPNPVDHHGPVRHRSLPFAAHGQAPVIGIHSTGPIVVW